MGIFRYSATVTIDGRPLALRIARLWGLELARFRAEWERRDETREQSDGWLCDVIVRHVTATQGGRRLTGADLIARYDDRGDVLGLLAGMVYLENTVTRAKKRQLPPSTFRPGSQIAGARQ